jgi:hypothetical protein
VLQPPPMRPARVSSKGPDAIGDGQWSRRAKPFSRAPRIVIVV